MNKKVFVFLLWHTNPSNEDEKLIGVYSTQENAESAQLSVKGQAGFKDFPEGFEICPYPLDDTCWAEGFISVENL